MDPDECFSFKDASLDCATINIFFIVVLAKVGSSSKHLSRMEFSPKPIVKISHKTTSSSCGLKEQVDAKLFNLADHSDTVSCSDFAAQ